MGLFSRKKHTSNSPEDVEFFFDEHFSEELRNRGRWYFENIIKENAERFQEDLDATIKQVNVELKDQITARLSESVTEISAELKEHVAVQVQEQLSGFASSMKESQDRALGSLQESADSLKGQYEDLRTTLRKSVDDQKVTLTNVFEENKVRIAAMHDAQNMALESLSHSVEALQKQHDKLKHTLEEHVEAQQELFIDAFKNNMAQVIEHYVLDALSGQYDLKDQLPSIIQQMEDKKQAIVDDMKL